MILSGHQPVYLPWLGLWHKLYLCDTFVYMDTVQYLENDWNNRNKIRTPQGWTWLTAPLDRKKTKGNKLHQIKLLTPSKGKQGQWQQKHWQAIKRNYGKAPFFSDYAKELENIYLENIWENLLDLCWAQFNLFSKWLGLDRKIVRMSEHVFNGAKDKLILDQAQQLKAEAVVFGCQGKNYVDLDLFSQNQIKVYFQDYHHPKYQQVFQGFEPGMSVLDLVFNHGPNSLKLLLEGNISRKELLNQDHWAKSH